MTTGEQVLLALMEPIDRVRAHPNANSYGEAP
jgi:hypothetical protein